MSVEDLDAWHDSLLELGSKAAAAIFEFGEREDFDPDLVVDVFAIGLAQVVATFRSQDDEGDAKRVTFAEIEEIGEDFLLTFAKTLARRWPDSIDEVTRRAIAARDRMVKRKRGLLTSGGDA